MRDNMFYATRLPKDVRDKIEAKALQIYDRENVEPYNRVKVSKHECLRRAIAIVAPPKTRRPNRPKP